MAGSKNQARQFAKLKEQIAAIQVRFLPELLENIADALDKEIARGFDEAKNPDGASWQKKGPGKPLDDTGALKRSRSVVVEDNKVIASMREDYAIFQQGPRNILPRPKRIGKNWAKVLRTEVRKTKKKYKEKKPKA